MTITSIFQQVLGFATFKRSTARPPQATPTATQEAWAQAMSEADAHKAFLAGIANLPADEQDKRIAKREWYRQLAERQGIIEAENQSRGHWQE